MNRIPLIGVSVVSVQLGAAIAASLFDRVGAPGTVLLRQGFAAAVLMVVARPRLLGRRKGDWLVVVVFGLVLAAMNVCFYEAVQRLPLGIAVTIELFGPLGLAAGLSRTARELAYVTVAAIGVVLLGGVTHHVDMAGVAFALCAGAGWASYILLSRRTGRRFGWSTSVRRDHEHQPSGRRDDRVAAAGGAAPRPAGGGHLLRDAGQCSYRRGRRCQSMKRRRK